MNELNTQLWKLSLWTMVTAVAGLFVWPGPLWVFFGMAGGLLFVVMLIAAAIGFSPADYLADIIRRARKP